MKTETITLHIHPGGRVKSIYCDGIEKLGLGACKINRAAFVEFNNDAELWEVRAKFKEWQPMIFSNKSREVCLAWERDWLNKKLVEPRS